MKIIFKEFKQLTPYTRQYTTKTINCTSYFINGGLLYAKLNNFNYKTIDKNYILKIEE